MESRSHLLDDISPLRLRPSRKRQVLDSARVAGRLQEDRQHSTQSLKWAASTHVYNNKKRKDKMKLGKKGKKTAEREKYINKIKPKRENKITRK